MANPPIATTFNAAPSQTLPSGTEYLDIKGRAVSGDYGDAFYRAVSSQPSHQGKLQVNGQWFELMGEFITPDQFVRTGDTDDAPSFQRANDYMAAKGVTTLKLASRLYDISSAQTDFQVPVKMIGSGFSEAGRIGGNDGIQTAYTQGAKGTYIKCNNVGRYGFNFSSYNSSGFFIDQLAFMQNHPTPTGSTWQPITYDYVINCINMLGGGEIGNVGALGIDKFFRAVNGARYRISGLRGQFYRQAVLIDNSPDVNYIGNLMHQQFQTADTRVANWSIANSKLVTLGRVDTLFANSLFGIVQNAILELRDFGSGYATDINIDALTADQSKYGIYADTPLARVHVGQFAHQAEAPPYAGQIIPGSTGIYVAAGGGQYTIDKFRSNYFSGAAVRNAAGNTIKIGSSPFLSNFSGVSAAFQGNGTPVFMDRQPISDLSGGLGTLNTDYIYPEDLRRFFYSGSMPANGGIIGVPHGLTFAQVQQITRIDLACRTTAGLTYVNSPNAQVSFIDGGNIAITSNGACPGGTYNMVVHMFA